MPVTELSRNEQLDQLFEIRIDEAKVLVHGSVGHAALMGEPLPSASKLHGNLRDIDVFAVSRDHLELEQELAESGLCTPNPVDAGLCGLLVHEGQDVWVSKDGITCPLTDGAIFQETNDYEIVGTDGISLHSFSPLGLLAVHSIEPRAVRVGHALSDRRLWHWFENHDVKLPTSLLKDIADFHRAYREAYPHANLYRNLAEAYVTLVPEAARKHLRRHTHRFMRDHTGRISPFAE